VKKILCVLFGCFITCAVFADGGQLTFDGRTVTTSWYAIEYVLNNSTDISPDNKTKMLNKAADISLEKLQAAGKKTSGGHDGGYTTSDFFNICIAGEITKASECYDKFVIPIFEFNRSFIFPNVCLENVAGLTTHCVDNVFVKSYSVDVLSDKVNSRDDEYVGNGLVKTSVIRSADNEFAQDVKVHEYAAFGFAYEYAKKNGHDVICSTLVQDNFINCSSLDHKHLYTFKFAGMDNTKDSAITENLAKGICAMYDTSFLGGSLLSGYRCDELNCKPGNDVNNVISRFGLTSYSTGSPVPECNIKRESLQGFDGIRTYPGHEYMSYAFKNVQAEYNRATVDVLKFYLKNQDGLDVESVDCDYAPQQLTDGYETQVPVDPMVGSSAMRTVYVPTANEDVITCRLDGVPVDFVFDDLYESKGYARRAGEAGMACLTAPAALAGVLNEKFTTKFDGKSCIGPGEKICNAMSDIIPGGTKWNEKKDRCVLLDARRAARINLAIEVAVDTVVFIATVKVGGGFLLISVTGLTTYGVTFGQAQLERFLETRPNKYAKEFVEAANECHISPENDVEKDVNSCSLAQKECAEKTLMKFFATMDTIMDGISDDSARYVAEFSDSIAHCITEDAGKRIEEKSSVMAGLQVARALNIFLMAISFVNPQAFTKFTLFKHCPRIMKWIKRVNETRLKKFTIGENLFRVDLNGKIPSNKIDEYVDALKQKGFVCKYVDMGLGRGYIEISTELTDISKIKEKAYKAVTGSRHTNFDSHLASMKKGVAQDMHIPKGTLSDGEKKILMENLRKDGFVVVLESNDTVVIRVDINVLKRKASANFDRYLQECNAGIGCRGLPYENLTPDEWGLLNKELRKGDVRLFERISDDGHHLMVFEKMGIKPQKYNSMLDIPNTDLDTLSRTAIYDSDVNDYVRSDLVDNTGFFTRLDSVRNKEIMKMGDASVKIVDSGSIGGRAIVIVEVGERKIPFYVSTGDGGKLNVPTGKWGVFFGLDGTWFVKHGDLMADQYGSYELKQIANKLDEVLGDPRNRLWIQSSQKRATQGGVGVVGDVDNMNLISSATVNDCFSHEPSLATLVENLFDIKSYLSGRVIEDVANVDVGTGAKVVKDVVKVDKGKAVGATGVNANSVRAKIERTDKGIKIEDRWEFTLATDKDGARYYEYTFDAMNGNAPEYAERLSRNLHDDCGIESFVVERADGQYVVGIYEDKLGDAISDGKGVGASGAHHADNSVRNKVYNDNFTDAQVQELLDEIHNDSLVDGKIDLEILIPKLRDSGLYDEAKAIEMADDLADEAAKKIMFFDENHETKIGDRLGLYESLNETERLELASELHEIITTLRRDHTGNTQIGYDFSCSWSFNSGLGTTDNPFVFKYGLDLKTPEGLVGSIFHENTHTYQTLGRTALSKRVVAFNHSNYVNPDMSIAMTGNKVLYEQNVIEAEAYDVAWRATQRLFDLLKL